MNVLEVYASYYKMGGVQVHIRDLCECLRRRGHSVSVLTYSERKKSSDHKVPIEIESYKIPKILLLLRYPAILILCFKLYTFSLNRKIDIIHVHGYTAAIAGSLVKKLLNKPVVATFHLLPKYTERSTPLLDIIEKSISSALFAQIDAIINVSKWNLLEMKKSGIKNSTNLLIRNWVPHSVTNVPSEQDSVYNERDSKKVSSDQELQLILIGRLSKQKGFDIFIKAANILSKKKLKFKAKIIGTGIERNNLLKLCEKLGLKNSIDFLGFISDSKKKSILNSSDIFVLPSRFEGLPLTILEAMYFEKPVIATDINGIKEVITNEVDGLIVNCTAKDIAQKLELLLTNDYFRNEIAKNARKKVEQKFSFKNCEDTILKLEMINENYQPFINNVL